MTSPPQASKRRTGQGRETCPCRVRGGPGIEHFTAKGTLGNASLQLPFSRRSQKAAGPTSPTARPVRLTRDPWGPEGPRPDKKGLSDSATQRQTDAGRFLHFSPSLFKAKILFGFFWEANTGTM